jgi:hypothetical protein
MVGFPIKNSDYGLIRPDTSDLQNQQILVLQIDKNRFL